MPAARRGIPGTNPGLDGIISERLFTAGRLGWRLDYLGPGWRRFQDRQVGVAMMAYAVLARGM
jgi:hypothetical protein